MTNQDGGIHVRLTAGQIGKRALMRHSGTYVFGLLVSLFFLWGVANNLNDILIKQFKKAFELSDFRAGLVQSAFYAGYFLLAIPAKADTDGKSLRVEVATSGQILANQCGR